MRSFQCASAARAEARDSAAYTSVSERRLTPGAALSPGNCFSAVEADAAAPTTLAPEELGLLPGPSGAKYLSS